MGIANFFVKLAGPDLIIKSIREQDWKQLGREQALPLDRMLDDKFGVKKSERIQRDIVPAIKAFAEGLTEGLLSDQKEDD